MLVTPAGMVRADLKDFDENEILRSFAGPLSQEDLPRAADSDLPPAADDDLPPEADE